LYACFSFERRDLIVSIFFPPQKELQQKAIEKLSSKTKAEDSGGVAEGETTKEKKEKKKKVQFKE